MITLMTLLFTSASLARKRDMNEKALQEIDSLIANPYESLGKSDSKIVYEGRPSSIIGDTEFTKNHEDCLIPQSAAILPQDRNQIACR